MRNVTRFSYDFQTRSAKVNLDSQDGCDCLDIVGTVLGLDDSAQRVQLYHEGSGAGVINRTSRNSNLWRGFIISSQGNQQVALAV